MIRSGLNNDFFTSSQLHAYPIAIASFLRMAIGVTHDQKTPGSPFFIRPYSVMMAVAAWLVWKRAGFKQARLATLAFLLQLALNAAWSWLFFGMHLTAWALVELILLWLSIIATLVLFARIDAVSGWLLAPYLLWVSFAGYLNFSLWRLNG